MRLSLKIVFVFINCFLSMCIVYPLMHEIGHMLMVLLLGGKIVQIGLFPPYVVCSSVDATKACIVALSGVALPICVALAVPKRLFSIWLSADLIFFESAIMIFASILNAFLFDYNKTFTHYDDFVSVVRIFPQTETFYLLVLFALFILVLFLLVKSRILTTFYNYLYRADK